MSETHRSAHLGSIWAVLMKTHDLWVKRNKQAKHMYRHMTYRQGHGRTHVQLREQTAFAESVKSSVKNSVNNSFKDSVKNGVRGSVKKKLTCASPFSASPSEAMQSSNLSLRAPSLLNYCIDIPQRPIQGLTLDCAYLSLGKGMRFNESSG